MFARSKELWLALLAIVAVTAGYLLATMGTGILPPASHLLGHGIGVAGFVLMLMTETLYTLRKRAKSARWGRVQSWLRFHIFTGLVGSYMVLLHPALRFKGIAAVLVLLTVIVVLSGVVGRYLYTRVPREAVPAGEVDAARPVPSAAAVSIAAGTVMGLGPAAGSVTGVRKGLAIWRAVHVPLTLVLFAIAVVHIVGAMYYATLLH